MYGRPIRPSPVMQWATFQFADKSDATEIDNLDTLMDEKP